MLPCCLTWALFWEPAVFFLQITDYPEVVAPKIRKPVHQIFIKNVSVLWPEQSFKWMTKTSNIPSLAHGRFTYGITCGFNTHKNSPKQIFLTGSVVGEKRIYVQTHTAAFLNSNMASKAEQKTSVSSTQQSPAPICHPFSREDYCFNMLSSHHLFCIQWASQRKKNLSI